VTQTRLKTHDRWTVSSERPGSKKKGARGSVPGEKGGGSERGKSEKSAQKMSALGGGHADATKENL